MMSNRALLVFSLAAVAVSTLVKSAPAEPPGPAAPPASAAVAEVSVPNTRKVDFVSKVNGHRYSISVALPFEPAPAKGYGVLYVLDGYSYFASAAEIARPWNAPAVVVVGIGYPDDPAFVQSVMARRGPAPAVYGSLPASRIYPHLERGFDLTLPASGQVLEAESLKGFPKPKSENVGGLDDFLKTIETEVKPRVATLVPIDKANQAILGDSLGGLAVVHALFVEPNAFRTFIAGSPSIWWNNKAVLADEPKFAAAVSSGQASPRVLVTIGSTESTPPKVPASWGVDPADLDALIGRARMVENGAELVAWLKTLHGGAGYVVADYAVFDQESHATSPWPAMVRGISFAFSTTP
jgi:uncharacterized protein